MKITYGFGLSKEKVIDQLTRLVDDLSKGVAILESNEVRIGYIQDNYVKTTLLISFFQGAPEVAGVEES